MTWRWLPAHSSFATGFKFSIPPPNLKSSDVCAAAAACLFGMLVQTLPQRIVAPNMHTDKGDQTSGVGVEV